MDVVAIEIMSTVFMALEDFGKLLVATKSRPPLWPRLLISLKEGRSLAELEARKAFSIERVRQVFSLKDAADYGLADESGVVSRYHEHLAEEFNRVLDRASRFVILHRLAYDRYKHGNPVLFGMKGRPPGPGIEAPVTILEAPPSEKRGEIILVGPLVLERQLRLVARVTHMSRLICQRWMQVAEFGGMPPLVLARVETEGTSKRVRANYFRSMPPDIKAPLNTLATVATNGLEWTPIEITFEAAIEKRLLDGLIQFYSEEWP